MIVAVADFVENKTTDAPHQLIYAQQAQNYGALPNPGGLRNQPAKLMLEMRVLYNVWNAFSQFKGAGFSPDWIKNNPGLWSVVTSVEEIRASIANNGE